MPSSAIIFTLILSTIDDGITDEPSKSPSYLKGYNDYHKFHCELSLPEHGPRRWLPTSARGKKEYAAGWRQAAAEFAETEAEAQRVDALMLGSGI
jgi:hypothetical protein